MRRVIITLAAVAAMALGGLAYMLTTAVGGSAQTQTSVPATQPAVTTPSSGGDGAHGAARAKRGPGLYALARRVVHAELVVKGKAGTYKTVDIDRGTISALSSSSISVTRPDQAKVTEAVTSTTRFPGKAASQLKAGDKVIVASSSGAAIAVRSPGAHGKAAAGAKGPSAGAPATTAPAPPAPG